MAVVALGAGLLAGQPVAGASAARPRSDSTVHAGAPASAAPSVPASISALPGAHLPGAGSVPTASTPSERLAGGELLHRLVTAGSGGKSLRIFNPAPSPIDVRNATACGQLPVACSANWAGEEAWGTTFTGVSADWNVPTVVPTSSSPEDSSVWIGLDGDPLFDSTANAPLLQVGTDAFSSNGTLSYEAWYELIPGAEIPLFTVSPGDQMQASIEETAAGSNLWDLTISDVTSKLTWSVTGLSYQAPGYSADAVVEAATLCSQGGTCATSQLQNFGTVQFGNLQFSDATGAPNLQQDDMADSSGNVIAYPTPGTGTLSVAYGSPGPPPVQRTSVSLPSGFQAMVVDPSTGNVYVSSSTSASAGTVTELSPAGAVLNSATVAGAAGLAIENGQLYVATPTEVVELSETDLGVVGTLAVRGGLANGADLVSAKGGLWSLNPSNELVEVQLTGTATTYATPVVGSRLVGDPADASTLFSYVFGESLGRIDQIDLSTSAPTMPQSIVSEGENMQDVAVSTDGQTLVFAAGYPYEFVGLQTSNLGATVETFPAAAYPNAVATTGAAGGELAGATSAGGSATVDVYPLSAPSTRTVTYSFPPATGGNLEEVDPGGLAFSPRGRRLYAVTSVTTGSTPGPTALSVLTLAPVPSSAYGELSGSVTGADLGSGSQVVPNACVALYAASGVLAYVAQTDAGGKYLLPEVVPGTYRLLVDPTCGGSATSAYAAQFYGGDADPSTATPVVVTEGSAGTVDVPLEAEAQLSGVVTDASGPVVSSCVALETPGGVLVQVTTTDSAGNYSFANLPGGTYLVEVDPSCGGTQSSGDALSYFGGTDPSSATPVAVSAGGAVTGIDVTLQAGATISGTVSAPGAANAAGVCVFAGPSSGNVALAVALTSSGGSYTIANLPGGSYTVAFDPTCAGLQASDFGSAQVSASVATGATTSGVDATLTLGAARPTITSASLPSGTVGSPYVAALEGTGTDGVLWAANGSLPAGLSLSPGGMITGTPSAAGTFTVEVVATDESVPTVTPVTTQLVLTIAASSTGGGGGTGSPGGGGGGGGAPPPPPPTTPGPVATPPTVPSPAPTPSPTVTVTPTPPPPSPNPLVLPVPPGTPHDAYLAPVTTTVGAGGATVTTTGRGARVAVLVPTGVLPAGSELGVAPAKDGAALRKRLPAGVGYVASFAVSWETNGHAAVTPKPGVTVQIASGAIEPGDAVYVLTATGVHLVGRATTRGRVSIRVRHAVDVIVAAVPQLSLVGRTATRVGKKVRLELGCRRGAACSGTGRLRIEVGSGKRRHALVLAEGHLSLRAGQRARVELAETGTGAKLLGARRQRVETLLVVRLRGARVATYPNVDVIAAAVPQLSLVGHTATTVGKKVRVELGCRKGPACSGTGRLRIEVGSGKHRHALVLAEGHLSLRSGRRAQVVLAETSEGVKLLGAARGRGVAAQLLVRLGAGRVAIYAVRVLPAAR